MVANSEGELVGDVAPRPGCKFLFAEENSNAKWQPTAAATLRVRVLFLKSALGTFTRSSAACQLNLSAGDSLAVP